MSSIPFKPRRGKKNDIGPTYYNPSTLDNTKQQFSTSSKGNSSFNSKVDRFPLRHNTWGMPGPQAYEKDASFHMTNNKSLNQSATYESQAFLTTTRDNYAYQPPSTQTPALGTYETQLCKTLQTSIYDRNRKLYNKVRQQSTTSQLAQEAAAAQKSLSRYLVESDPNYIPMPPKLEEISLAVRPVNAEGTPDQQNKISTLRTIQHLEQVQKVKFIKNKYQLDTKPRYEVLAAEMQDEIQQTFDHYAAIYPSPQVITQLPSNVLEQCAKIHLQKLPLVEGGVAFNTRFHEKIDPAKELKEEQVEIEQLRGPGAYNVDRSFKQTANGDKRVNELAKMSVRDTTIVKSDVPGVGSYDVKMLEKKSFLLNEEKKWV